MAGKSESLIAKTKMSSAASQKFGTAMPRLPVQVTSRSVRPPRTAAAMPRTRPNTSVTRVDRMASDRVGASDWDRASETDCPVVYEEPRSPWTAWLSQEPNCERTGWSSPRLCCSVSTCSWVALLPRIAAATLPGTSWTRKNEIVATTSSRGMATASRRRTNWVMGAPLPGRRESGWWPGGGPASGPPPVRSAGRVEVVQVEGAAVRRLHAHGVGVVGGDGLQDQRPDVPGVVRPAERRLLVELVAGVLVRGLRRLLQESGELRVAAVVDLEE